MYFTELFYKALIAGGAWKTILQGLFVTLQITLLSLLFGILLAIVICAMRLSKYRVLRGIASMYTSILRGSPILLLLMLMYYVVFAKSNLPAPLVAVAAFSLNASAHVSELMRGALLGVKHRQIEAARTLGFTGMQAFRHVTLPQAFSLAEPVFQSLIVNLIQWTSVVGYVTIADLTRVINNISARTMQPLFMIAIGIILYLCLAYLTYGIFALCKKISEVRFKRRRAT